MASLRAQPLTAEGQFNWVFLIEVLVVGILSLFFLFYFNRVFAAAVSYAIRAYTWRKYKAYIDISALQISLLGGRIFFKSIRYHAHNVTVYVYEGHITWRYWLRLVQEAEVFQEEHQPGSGKQRTSSTSASEKESLNGNDEKSRTRSRSIGKEEKGGTKPKKELPCRIAVKVAGVEAFIYNRSPLYDGIVEATLGKSKDVFGEDSERDDAGSPTSSPNSSGTDPKEGVEKTQTRTTTASASPPVKPEIPAFLRMFPIKIDCKRAAAAVGNENTTNVLVAKAEKSAGTVDAGHAGPLDLWKLLFNFGIENVDVTMKPNRDFKEFQLDAAQRILRERQMKERDESEVPIVKVAHQAQGFWAKLKRMLKRSRSSADSIRTASMQSDDHKPSNPLLDQLPGPGQWHGLMRYLDDDDDDEHDEWRKVEYAKASQLVECDKVTMRFYWDMSGPVPDGGIDSQNSLGSMHLDDINGSAPPEYGMDLGVYGGFVVYGPWADRQRFNLQSVFFPAPCVDAIPAKPLKPGELRVCTVFKIAVIVEEDVVLRIPAREESKDPRWKGRAENAAKPPEGQADDATKGERRRWGRHGKRRKAKKGITAVDARPYAWLDITVKKDSVVNYVMDMFPRPAGYRNSLDLDVRGLEMSSSVNHGLLWRSGPLTLDADISQPLTWNSLRKWPFNIVVNDLELFILRDHLFLIIDLVNDWASGAPSNFYTFVPYNYQINLVFNNFVMYLNVNDCCIINDPADFDKNDFITLEGQISANLGIPMESYRPKRNGITFDVLGEDLRMRMLSPPKSTFSAFVQDKTMAELPRFTLKGSHNANQEARVGNVDVLRMDIVGTGLSLKAYGFFVRQLVSLKENYFGDYMHFKTLEEFQGASDDLEKANAKTASFPKPTSINELDVILCIVAEEATVMFPTNLYSCKEFVRVELPRADVDLRIASYYLDLGLQLSPLSFLSGAVPSGVDDNDDSADEASNTQFFVAHVDLNGHRAFGLPPNEDAYVSQWDIDIGKVTGEMSSVFVRDLALAGRAFAFCIGDDENALPVSSPAVALDASFVQVRTDTVRLWLHVGKDALLLSTEPITVETSDWANETFSQRVNVLVPQITIACVDGRSASRKRVAKHRKRPVKTYAFLQTGLSLDVVGRKLHFDTETKRQQSHFRLHDQRTNRFPFLQRSSIDAPIKEEDDLPFEPPAMPFPPMPPPLTMTDVGAKRPASLRSVRSLASGKRLSSKSSTSSLSASLRTGRGAAMKRPDLLSGATERSTGGTSASFHSMRASSRSSSYSHGPLSGDIERARFGLPLSTVAFSSSYSEPYFPLEMVEPDETNVPSFPLAADFDSQSSDTSASTRAISNPDVDDDCEYSSVMIKIIPGIRAYVLPHVATTASKLVREVLPHNPDEVMDAFQMGVMGTIQSHNAERHGVKRTTEIQAELPAAHIRVAIQDENKDEVADQLDLTLRSLATCVRIRTQPVDAGPTQCLALHTLLSGLDLTLVNRQASIDTVPAIRLGLDDALVWLALSDTKAFHVSTRSASLVVAGDQAKYLTSLVLKLVPLINDLKLKFEGIFDLNLRRLRLLAHVLTQHGEQLGDPAFMARMVYILRAFPLHFRNTDSWKILARFRFILRNLPQDARDELELNFKEARSTELESASVKALESWTQWRNWDVPYVTQTVAFKTLCCPDDAKEMETSEIKPTTMTFRTELLRIGIERSEGNSDISLEDLSLGVENSPPIKPEGLMLVDENKRTKTLLQMHTSTIAFSLDWALFHVAEDVLAFHDQFQELAASMETSNKRTASQAFEDGLSRHDVHVVLSTDTGSISLQSINLRHVSRADGLKLSVITTTQANEEYGQCASAIMNFDTAVTELHGPHSRICQTLMTSPSLYIDHLQAATGVDMPPTITLALAYEELQVVVNEQIPGILHIVETVIAEEVATVQRLVLSLAPPAPTTQSQSSAKTTASKTVTASPAPKLHIGLLAGNINFEFSLLQALSYQLQGRAASFRLAPSLSKDQQFSIDFDVGRQNHAIVNSSSNDRHTQGVLDFPPINGHVGVEVTDERTSISVATTIEKIEVDAGALQGIMSVVNQPEVEGVISAIKSGVQDVQAQIAELYPADAEVRRQKKETYHETAFDVRFALLGVRVAAVTPGNSGRSTAEVEFGIGPVHATASNRGSDMTAKSLIPEVRAHIQDIGASLRIRERGKIRQCGNATLSIGLHFTSKTGEQGLLTRELNVRSNSLDINAYPETASTIVDVINHLQDRIKHLDLSKEVDYLRRLRDKRKDTVMRKIKNKQCLAADQELPFSPEDLLSIKTNLQLDDIQACWLIDPSFSPRPRSEVDDLIFSIKSVNFSTRGVNEARLTILDMQLQLAKKEFSKQQRALNSALLPEIGFSVAYWSEGKNRSLAFKATGKPLDLRLESKFMFPVTAAQRSIELAINRFKKGTETWRSTPTTTGAPRGMSFDTKRVTSLLVEADFAGAQVYMQGATKDKSLSSLAAAASQRQGATHGRYGQFAAEGALMHTTLTAPGIAFKMEYNSHEHRPTVNGELRIDASSNMLLPNVVPLVLEVTNSVKEVMQSNKQTSEVAAAKPSTPDNKATQKFFEEESIANADPTRFFGKTKVDLGFRICKQEFGLTCQPIARVDAKASLDDIYITMNTIDSDEHGHFFAMSAVVTKLKAEVQHVYSKEPTFSFDMDSVVLSAMNNKHLSGTPGVSAILNVNPTRIVINGKQLQDLLLFREIWMPPEIRNAAAAASGSASTTQPSAATSSAKGDDFFVQRYQSVASAAAFPWNATVSITRLSVDLDLGQSIGKSSFTINNLWASQQKSSNWEQNLCVGLDEMAVNSTGRMSGFVQLAKLGVRTSIKWPKVAEDTARTTPLIQASVGFQKLKAKAAFDYQAFAFADIESFDFLMYNVREASDSADRLVAVLDCEKAYVFCTSNSPAQAVGLYQAFDRLVQEKQAAHVQSLRDIEKHIRRESTVVQTRFGPAIPESPIATMKEKKTSITLHTDVVVTMGNFCFGIYPSTFFDSQMLKVEASNIQARFAVGLESGKLTSGLGMTLGQLQVALSSARKVSAVPKALDVSVEDVINNALNAKGGTILRVPKVVASMQTWQADSNNVDYIFKSLFDGKIDVGWNLSRINFIKGMWTSHSRALASRLGKSLPESAVKITAGGPQNSDDDDSKDGDSSSATQQQEKITAEINLPQSRYEYHALEPPIIETPQLRDLGEATPSLHWIGLDKDRLPNFTHQIVIVSLLEVCKEVQDAYEKILGSS